MMSNASGLCAFAGFEALTASVKTPINATDQNVLAAAPESMEGICSVRIGLKQRGTCSVSSVGISSSAVMALTIIDNTISTPNQICT